MTEGHPCFVANNGRLGFGVDDYPRYAPEAGAPVRPAVARRAPRGAATSRRAPASTTSALPRASWAPATLARFADAAARPRAGPGRLPLPPGAPVAVGEQARRHLRRRRRPPRPGAARRGRRRVPRRSSRSGRSSTPPTPTGTTSRRRSPILNMGFMRGLSAAYMAATPAINDWLADLIGERRRRCGERGFGPARARVGRLHRRRLPPHADARRRTARCSPRCGARARCRASADGERLATMAVAAARRPDGRSFAAALHRASGLAARRSGCAATCAPTCARCCTASTRTTSCSCRTARTSSWCSTGTCRRAIFIGHRRGDRRARRRYRARARRGWL